MKAPAESVPPETAAQSSFRPVLSLWALGTVTGMLYLAFQTGGFRRK